jgi:competence protein ComFC
VARVRGEHKTQITKLKIQDDGLNAEIRMTNDVKVSAVTDGGTSFGFRHWRRYATALLDLVYTRRCEICEVFVESGREGMKRWLCEKCFTELARIEAPFCQVCGEPYDGAIAESFRCANCTDLKLHFDFAVAGFKAERGVRELVHRFKYQRALHLRGLLGDMLKRAMDDPRLRGGSTPWVLVPVPLHHARHREREYNQAMELCRVLAKGTALPIAEALSRLRPTTAQASLSRRQRIENLRGAFSVKRGVRKKDALKGRAVLLVDDVLTTGSTTSECARVLRKEAGVEKVVVITVARG